MFRCRKTIEHPGLRHLYISRSQEITFPKAAGNVRSGKKPRQVITLKTYNAAPLLSGRTPADRLYNRVPRRIMTTIEANMSTLPAYQSVRRGATKLHLSSRFIVCSTPTQTQARLAHRPVRGRRRTADRMSLSSTRELTSWRRIS
jgi:hypothetical protein